MRILIIHPGALGDLLLAIPAILALRSACSPCMITIIAGTNFLDFLKHHQVADATISIDTQALAALCSNALKRSTLWGYFFSEFERIVAWMDDADGMIEYALRTLGVRDIVIQSPRHAERRGMPLREWYRSSVEQWCDVGVCHLPCIVPTSHELGMGKNILVRANVLTGKNHRIVAIHPGSGSRAKNWDVHRFVDGLRDIKNTPDLSSIVLCGPADDAVVSSLLDSVSCATDDAISVVKDLSLLQLVGVLGHCAAYIGNDSGVTHLAASIGVSTIAVYGPTDPRLWAPLGEHVLCFRGSIGCRCSTTEEQLRCHRPCFPGDTNEVWRSMHALCSE